MQSSLEKNKKKYAKVIRRFREKRSGNKELHVRHNSSVNLPCTISNVAYVGVDTLCRGIPLVPLDEHAAHGRGDVPHLPYKSLHN